MVSNVLELGEVRVHGTHRYQYQGEKDIFLSCLNHKICRYWCMFLTNDGMCVYLSRTYMFLDLTGRINMLQYYMLHFFMQNRSYIPWIVHACCSVRQSSVYYEVTDKTWRWKLRLYYVKIIAVVRCVTAVWVVAGSYRLSEKDAVSSFIK
jgi:hypothetical protein